MLALALPLTSNAQGNSSNTPAADHRQNGDNGNNNNNNNNNNGQGNDDNGHGMAPVPEPATWAAMASLVALGALFARRHVKHSAGNAT